MNNNKIGQFIAKMRKQKGLTQKELGDKLFVTDKAVSKWERGLSLPDISLLKKMASLFEIEIIDILEGEITNSYKNIDLENRIQELNNQIEIKNKQKNKKITIVLTLLIVILGIVLFRNINLGYTYKKVYYSHANKNITIGIPKLSFMIKNNDASYSMKNIRSSHIIENETKKYFKTLQYSNCNDSIYYYDKKHDISIIEYRIKNNLVFTTLSYEIIEGDYCISKKIEEYSQKLNGLNRTYIYGDGKIYLDEKGNKLIITFTNKVKDSRFLSEMKVLYYENIENLKENREVKVTTIEESIGTFEIRDNKLYYYREKIKEQNGKIKIPEVSVFDIKDGNLILKENYLSQYGINIVLK